jgi:hypothetical protein
MHCSGDSSDVWVKQEAAVDANYDVKRLIIDLEMFVGKQKNHIAIEFTEPYLAMELEEHQPRSKTDGEIEISIRITPNQLVEEHKYIFGVTEKEVRTFIAELKQLLVEYPITGNYHQSKPVT